jgi:NDP-sugar pyrophosphorylase family protein
MIPPCFSLAGPNVSIGKNARIGGGTRIRESIVLGNSAIGEHSLILYSVIGRSFSVNINTYNIVPAVFIQIKFV